MFLKTFTYYIVKIDDIETIKKTNWTECGFGGLTLRLGNKIVWNYVLIRKKKGFLKKIIITPDNPDQFVEQIKQLKSTKAI